MRLLSINLTYLWVLLFQVNAFSQVLDVNDDNTVGAEEALAVAESWKGTPATPNGHNHLGQTWNGNSNPLRIQGNFPPRSIIGPVKEKGTAGFIAPLMLENTSSDQFEGARPDLILNGSTGVLGAYEAPNSILRLEANHTIRLRLDADDNTVGSFLYVMNGGNSFVFRLDEDGNLFIGGDLDADNVKRRIDHPLDPAGKYLVHSSVNSPESKNVYDGVAILDEKGEAIVDLPDYFEAANSDFRYQLTCIGGFAPVYVAEKIENNRFKIAGGTSNQEISWQVTGIRNDAQAKAFPVVAEEDKSAFEKGRYLHPELFGETLEKSLWTPPAD